MHSTLALVGAFASVALASPIAQGVTDTITPSTSAPSGCSPNYNGKFEITAVKPTKRDLEKRACGADGSLTITLANGILTDSKARIGYIADNFQFQFDGPPQAGSLFTGGFSICGNGALALGSSTTFYQCLSGSFYNLYDRNWAAQCEAISIYALPCGGNIGQIGDGQVTGTGAAPRVTQIADGQIQGQDAIAVSELPDGQPQVVTAAPAAPPVTQIGDGQIQAPTGVPVPVVSQIGDGQIQAPVAVPGPVVTQIGDGQIQAPVAPAGPVVTQIGDGQIQAPVAPAGPVVTQIGDGQIQAPAGPVVTQIGDGQIQAPARNGTAAQAPQQIAVGAGMSTTVGSSIAFAFAGLAAVLLL